MSGDEQNQAGADPFAGFGGGAGFNNFWGGGRQGQAGGGFQDFADFFNMGMGGDRMMKGQDIFINLDVEFMDAVKGTKKEINFEKIGTCSTCKGT